MRKFGRNKIALLLLLLHFSGGKTSAMELNKVKTQNLQTLEAVGGAAATKNSNRGFINWVKNHKWQLLAGTLTTATIVTLTALSIKYLIVKNKEEPKKEEPKEKELKNVMPKEVSFKKEDSEQKVPKEKEKFKKEDFQENKEPKEKELKNKEAKKENSQEVYAVNYILDKTKEAIDKYIKSKEKRLDIEEIKSTANKVFSMIESYFNKIKGNNWECTRNIEKTLINYFNGKSKMQSKNIYVYFGGDDLLAILNFDECSFYITVDRISGKFRLKSFPVNIMRIINEYKYSMPPDTHAVTGKLQMIYESELLDENK